jgi:hypothetical protein
LLTTVLFDRMGVQEFTKLVKDHASKRSIMQISKENHMQLMQVVTFIDFAMTQNPIENQAHIKSHYTSNNQTCPEGNFSLELIQGLYELNRMPDRVLKNNRNLLLGLVNDRFHLQWYCGFHLS